MQKVKEAIAVGVDLWFSTGTYANIWGHLWLSQLEAGGGTTGMWWAEVKDAAKHSTVPRLHAHHKELSGPERQQCRG